MRRTVVVGCGDVSAVHFDAVDRHPEIELAAVCDADPDRLAAAVARFGVPGYRDHRELLARERPDVVHVCTPHHTHADLAVAALEAGVHVLLEKPVAATAADARRVIAAAETSPAKIAVCFQNRYNPTSQALRDALRSGSYGEVLGARASVIWARTREYYRDRPWRGEWATAGGGVLMNQAIHTVDLLQWLLGEVDTATGNAATHVLADTIEVEDTAHLVLTHHGGARSVLFATVGYVENAPVSLEVLTDKVAFRLGAELTVLHGDGREELLAASIPATGERAYWGRSHEALIGDFYSSLDAAEPFWIGPAEALKSLQIILDIYDQSALPGR